MSQGYRKLRVLLNTKKPRFSRIVDAETGEEFLVSDVQINFGHSTKYQLRVQLTLEVPGVEIVVDEPDDPLGVSELVK
jgi:hypothetical protein